MPDPKMSSDQDPRFQKSRPGNHQLTIIALVTIIVGVLVIGIWAYALQGQRSLDNTSGSSSQLDDSTDNVDNSIDSLLIELTITGNPNKLFSLASITRYDGYVADAKLNDAQYTLELVNANGLAYTSYFNVPTVIAETVTAEGVLTRAATYPQKSIAIKTPNAPEGSKIIVRDKAGKIVYEDTVRGVVTQESGADYETIPGDDTK
jgi:hypothetical protein